MIEKCRNWILHIAPNQRIGAKRINAFAQKQNHKNQYDDKSNNAIISFVFHVLIPYPNRRKFFKSFRLCK